MQLEYNILWIDNDIDEYIANGEVESIRTFLNELGFESNVETVDDEAKLDNFIFKHKYDLILSDFNLNATTGDVIIQEIRENKRFSTEILFYSAKNNFRDEPEVKERLAFMDRITFHTNRDTFLDKVEKLIILTLDKLLELNATRGLITAETSQLDVIIEELTLELVNRLKLDTDRLKGIVDDYADNFLSTRSENFKEKYKEIGFNNIFQSIEANRKWSIFRILLKEYNKEAKSTEIGSFLKKNSTYFDQVIDIRNKFAHSKAKQKEGKMVLIGQFGKDDFQFDSEQCIGIRKSIIEHRSNFKDLLEHIKFSID
jgi:CheY-like chemotaxis protein